MKRFLTGVLSLALALSLAACSGGGGGGGGGGAATPTPSGSSGGGDAASTELNIYMWQQYISDQLIADFEAATTARSTCPT